MIMCLKNDIYYYINYVCEGCVVTHRLSLATRGIYF